jgi:hypothetical protein
VHYACNPAFVPAARKANLIAIVNAMPGVSKPALCRAASGNADIFASGEGVHDADNSSQRRNHLAATALWDCLPWLARLAAVTP